ncbi:MAG: PadR family transcriptional regulator [Acidobacteriaceae bacterium]|jgi:PadR family transcriptional regulator PadR
MNPETLDNLRLELRRGCLVLAVLAALRSEQYGYTLRKALAEQGMDIDEGTLYPLLRRLESQGLLASEWREHEKRNKRFYRLSAEGEPVLTQLLAEWQSIDTSIRAVITNQAITNPDITNQEIATHETKEPSNGSHPTLPAGR